MKTIYIIMRNQYPKVAVDDSDEAEKITSACRASENQSRNQNTWYILPVKLFNVDSEEYRSGRISTCLNG